MIKYLQVQGNPYRLLEVIQNLSLKNKFVFVQDPQSSSDAAATLQKLNLPIKDIVVNTIKFQSEASSPDIIRATFRIKGLAFAEIVEVLFNKAKG